MRSTLVRSYVVLVTLSPVWAEALSGNACELVCFTTDKNITEVLADCSYKHLNGVPDNLPDNITYLNLDENSITKLNGTIWSRYKLLKGLSLASNKIQIIQQSDFQGLHLLEKLDLSLNRIRYTDASIDKNVFIHLKALTYLDIKQNLQDIWPNETYPQAISTLSNLQNLMIDGLDTQFVYNLPRLNELYLSGEYGRCNISVLTKWYFSANHNIQNLFISKCSIQWIDPCPFQAMYNISSLDLSDNTDLGLDVMGNITCIATIKQLNLNSLYDYIYYDTCSSLTMSATKFLYNTSIKLLTLESDYVVRMDDQAAQYFPPSLKYLSISDNLFMYGKYIETLIERNLFKNLVYFDTSQMLKTHITETIRSNHTPTYRTPRLERTRNADCLIVNEKQFRSELESMFTRMKVKDYFKVIRERVPTGVTVSAENNESMIQYIDVSQNHPNTYEMTAKLFKRTPHLIFLNVSNNFLGYPLVTSEKLFQNLAKVQTLDLSNNQLMHLNHNIFNKLLNLRYLYLATNRIKNLSFDISNLKDLVYLDIKTNHLEQVMVAARNALDKLTSQNITINISNNPLRCTCHNFDFVKWLHTTKVRFDNIDETNCSFDNDTQIPVKMLAFDAFVFECSPPKFNIVILISSLGLLSFVVIVSCGIVYRYKWNLRYLYYMTKFKLTGGYQPIENTKFEKDVFVSYANEDGGFVYQNVVPELEQKGNISLLVHDRDFEAGELVADNIMRAITSSRRTLAILTRAYIQSKWCMYELNMARMEAADTGRNVLYVILKENVLTKSLPVEVIEIIKTKTYLEFPEAEEHAEGFWDRLRATLTRTSS